jgi:hypothetical protein
VFKGLNTMNNLLEVQINNSEQWVPFFFQIYSLLEKRTNLKLLFVENQP